MVVAIGDESDLILCFEIKSLIVCEIERSMGLIGFVRWFGGE